MPKKTKSNVTEDLVKALQDQRVRAIFGALIEDRLKSLIDKVELLTSENVRQAAEIQQLNVDLTAANQKITSLEAYTRRDNLIIDGLQLCNAAEAVTTPTGNESTDGSGEHAASTEKVVLDLFQNQLKLPITSSDISIAHRLRRNPNSNGPPPVIVRFSTRKARDTVYAARTQLRNSRNKIFINEDLTSTAAGLFFQARKLVSQKKIYKAWTNKGDVYIKLSDSSSTKPQLVRTLNDLPPIN